MYILGFVVFHVAGTVVRGGGLGRRRAGLSGVRGALVGLLQDRHGLLVRVLTARVQLLGQQLGPLGDALLVGGGVGHARGVPDAAAGNRCLSGSSGT